MAHAEWSNYQARNKILAYPTWFNVVNFYNIKVKIR